MIAIHCPAYPVKGQTTILTTCGTDWEVEVRNEHGFGIVTREPSLDCTLDLAGALDILWEADNGAADELVRALNLPDEVRLAAWERHRRKHDAPPAFEVVGSLVAITDDVGGTVELAPVNRTLTFTLPTQTADIALMRLTPAGNPHRLYQQISEADTRRRRGALAEVVLHLDGEERAALRAVLPPHLQTEVPT